MAVRPVSSSVRPDARKADSINPARQHNIPANIHKSVTNNQLAGKGQGLCCIRTGKNGHVAIEMKMKTVDA